MSEAKKTHAEKFWEKVDVRDKDDCWIWQGRINEKGYGRLQVGSVQKYSHRYAWELSNNQEIPNGKIIMHLCDTPLCCNPNHLSIGTQTENIADMNAKKRHCKGTDKINAKLNEQSVKEIRELLSNGMSPPAIAEKFNVSRGAIHQVKKGITWRHI